MNRKLRYLIFVGLPFLVFGMFWFTAGLMHGQPNAEPRPSLLRRSEKYYRGNGRACAETEHTLS